MLTPRLQRLWTWARAYDDDATRLEAALSIVLIVAMVFAALSVSDAAADVRTRYDGPPNSVGSRPGPWAPGAPTSGSMAAAPTSDGVGTRR